MTARKTGVDAITLEVLRHALTAVAEEMQANLIRAAYSPNIKERRDCSCAVFDRVGRMVAQAESIPVHLGAMPASVEAAVARIDSPLAGDVIVVNDPYAGGAHLPDVTFVAPVFASSELVGFVANRAHHADVGGKEPGSLAGDAREIYQEGLRIPPVKLWRRGKLDGDLVRVITANVRTPEERMGDLRAQKAANETGRRRFVEVVEKYGLETVLAVIGSTQDYSERRMRAEIERLPDGVYEYEDYLDGGGIGPERVRISAAVTVRGSELCVDFTGSSEQVEGPINAVYAVTASATYYAVRALTDPDIPPNEGCYRPVEIVAPAGTVVNAVPPAAVVGGNLETSQRIVDVLIGALAQAVPQKAVAASQGTMNSVTLGGKDPRSGRPYTIYETVGGGMGGRSDRDGVDGIQCHMTNTLNTPVEALEIAYPLRVERYEFRPDTCGPGRWRGGLGVRRDIRVVGHRASLSLLGDRRELPPYGLFGGGPGRTGSQYLIIGGEERPAPARGSLVLEPDTVVSVRTPGGGGYGPPADRPRDMVVQDYREGRISAEHAIEHYGFDPRGQ